MERVHLKPGPQTRRLADPDPRLVQDETAYSAATPTPTSQCARPTIGWLPQTRMIQPQRTRRRTVMFNTVL
jgi:hypothetical protein